MAGTICWCGVAGFTCTIWHTRLNTQWHTICLKWENNEAQGVSIKFISCTVPQTVGRWEHTYFHQSSCVMTLPWCKWTGGGQRTERLDWWWPVLVRTPPTHAAHVEKQFFSKGSDIKQTSLKEKRLAGGISEGGLTERVKGLIGNESFFSCRNLAHSGRRPKWCQPRLHHSYGKKNLSTHRMLERNKKNKCALRDWSVFLCAVDRTLTRRRMCRTGKLSQELFFAFSFF